MKALLVVASDQAFKLVSFYLRPLGFELIRYRQALKAMDNVDEVDPDAVIISAEDFPRHWKTFVQYVRAERPKSRTVIVILRGAVFPYQEAAKAAHIGVNGIVSENLELPEELDRLQRILGRYAPVKDSRSARRVRPADWDRLEFMFSKADDPAVVTGRIETISSTGLSFVPDKPGALDGLEADQILTDCSLRAGDSILSPSCRVVRVGETVAFAFEAFEYEERLAFEQYLRERPVRERKLVG